MTVDWSKPLVTNTGARATCVSGPDSDGDYTVRMEPTGVWSDGDDCGLRCFRPDGSHFDGSPVFIRNAPGTFESLAAPLIANLDAEIARLETKLAALKAAREVL